MIRVLLADDQDLIRLGLRVLLDSEDDLEVVGDRSRDHAGDTRGRPWTLSGGCVPTWS